MDAKICTVVVHEYWGPWAPGYFKGTCQKCASKRTLHPADVIHGGDNKVCGNQVANEPRDMIREESSQRRSSGLINSSFKHNSKPENGRNDYEDKEYTYSSDPSLQLAFASSIPPEVIKTTKLKKKNEGKRSGRSTIENIKDVSSSSTSARKTICKQRKPNPINSKEIMDFVVLIGLNIEGKEIETQHKIAKILQDVANGSNFREENKEASLLDDGALTLK